MSQTTLDMSKTTLKVPGVGMAKNCSGRRWIEYVRRTKPWAAFGPSGYKQYAKKKKARAERRKAKLDPETPPTYGRYQGWDD